MTKSYEDFSDLESPLFTGKAAASTPDSTPSVRELAHVANGGENTAPCHKCDGSGKFISYTGRVAGSCFACKGSGKLTARQAGVQKRKVTVEKNRIERFNTWTVEYADEFAYMQRRAQSSAFYSSLMGKLNDYGNLTENQLACVRRNMAEDEVKRQEWDAERATKSGDLDIGAIERLFATATDNDIKRPIFRAEGVEISKASARGRNAGALYVKSNEDVYLGKIVSGVFYASRDAGADTLDTLKAVACDPTAEAIKYARRTGKCSCCGRGLVDPVSIRAGIGPICADKWGLDYRRELARDELASEE